MTIDGFSRRDLLKNSAVAVLAATTVPVFRNAAWAAADVTKFDVPQKTPVIGSRKVNGENYRGISQRSIFLLKSVLRA